MDPATCKRKKLENGYMSSPGTECQSSILSHNRRDCLEFLEQCNDIKYGSVNKEFEAINVKRRKLFGILEKLQKVPIQLPYASPGIKLLGARSHSLGQSGGTYYSHDVLDLEADDVGDHTNASVDDVGTSATVLVVDSDDEDIIRSFGDEHLCGSNQHACDIQELLLPKQPTQNPEIAMLDNGSSNSEPQVVVKQGNDNMDIDNVFGKEVCSTGRENSEEIAFSDDNITSKLQLVIGQEHDKINTNDESDYEEKGESEGENENVGRKGSIEKADLYIVGYRDVSCELIQSKSPGRGSNNQGDRDNPVDELEDLWKDMSLAVACSKNIGINQSIVSLEKQTCEEVEVECHHSFLLKDDLGVVCCVCGLIQQRIENIFEYQWKKRKQLSKAYHLEPRNSTDPAATANQSGATISVLEVLPDALSVHPRHWQQMKPHQVEGFNFLVKNVADEDHPGGCILAHAPGSGKTFMLISFIHSFLARYPAGRPLIVLPKGILAIWRTEFLRWQVEDIPLYDFYSSKADNRSEQLKVLKLWEDNRSILLLGYQQFALIISDYASDREATACQEKLLKVPSLVILDEGHTPRNEQTDLLTSLANIQTPRKIVLSGTLFQNHVSEVFNILNLVRPKFLKMERSRAIVKRILSKLDMSGKKARSKSVSDKYFYDLVEENLQRDENDNMRAMMIQNLRELTENVLHYYRGEFLEELPGLVDFTIFLNPSSKQREIIKGLVRLTKFGRRSTCNAVSLHPCLKDVKNVSDGKDRGVTDGKIDSILHATDISDGVKAKFIYNLLSLSEASGEKVLVFSQYVRSLLFLERLVVKIKGWYPEMHTFKIHGGSSQDQRERAVERFNNSPDAKVFFGSMKACGEGISLVGASRVVILDVHENPSVMRQAIGRAFRPGQAKMVYCYRLVAADSQEEEDHQTAFRKERISKMWFEWDEFCSNEGFDLTMVDASDSTDKFLESAALREDIKSLYKR